MTRTQQTHFTNAVVRMVLLGKIMKTDSEHFMKGAGNSKLQCAVVGLYIGSIVHNCFTHLQQGIAGMNYTTIRNNKVIKAVFDCHCDSLTIYHTFKDRVS